MSNAWRSIFEKVFSHFYQNRSECVRNPLQSIQVKNEIDRMGAAKKKYNSDYNDR